MSNLIKYYFKTKAVDDFRPLVDMADINMPWWCTGRGEGCVTIICYLPKSEDLFKYWDDAYDVDIDEVDEIIYSSRFPKPSWIVDEVEND